MTGELFATLEATALAGALRGSIWAYPLVNAGHLLGVALVVGAIVPLDLRLLGLWASVPLPPLWRVLTRTAAAGLALVVGCGVLLFITRATAYAESSLFLSKMVVVLVGTANALVLRSRAHRDLFRSAAPVAVPVRVKLMAAVSLAAWLCALTLGRLVGYF